METTDDIMPAATSVADHNRGLFVQFFDIQLLQGKGVGRRINES